MLNWSEICRHINKKSQHVCGDRYLIARYLWFYFRIVRGFSLYVKLFLFCVVPLFWNCIGVTSFIVLIYGSSLFGECVSPEKSCLLLSYAVRKTIFTPFVCLFVNRICFPCRFFELFKMFWEQFICLQCFECSIASV